MECLRLGGTPPHSLRLKPEKLGPSLSGAKFAVSRQIGPWEIGPQSFVLDYTSKSWG